MVAGRQPRVASRPTDTSPPVAGVEMIKLLLEYGADLDLESPKGWTPLSYAKAKGKYGATEEKGVYPEVRGAQRLGSGGVIARGKVFS